MLKYPFMYENGARLDHRDSIDSTKPFQKLHAPIPFPIRLRGTFISYVSKYVAQNHPQIFVRPFLFEHVTTLNAHFNDLSRAEFRDPPTNHSHSGADLENTTSYVWHVLCFIIRIFRFGRNSKKYVLIFYTRIRNPPFFCHFAAIRKNPILTSKVPTVSELSSQRPSEYNFY